MWEKAWDQCSYLYIENKWSHGNIIMYNDTHTILKGKQYHGNINKD